MSRVSSRNFYEEHCVALYEIVLRTDQGYFAAIVFRRFFHHPYNGKCFSGVHTQIYRGEWEREGLHWVPALKIDSERFRHFCPTPRELQGVAFGALREFGYREDVSEMRHIPQTLLGRGGGNYFIHPTKEPCQPKPTTDRSSRFGLPPLGLR